MWTRQDRELRKRRDEEIRKERRLQNSREYGARQMYGEGPCGACRGTGWVPHSKGVAPEICGRCDGRGRT